jgi:hypothetical protein
MHVSGIPTDMKAMLLAIFNYQAARASSILTIID